MLRRVYIETTVPSFYHEVRPEPEMVAKKGSSRGSGGTASAVTTMSSRA